MFYARVAYCALVYNIAQGTAIAMLRHFPTHFSSVWIEHVLSSIILATRSINSATLSAGTKIFCCLESTIMPRCLMTGVGVSIDLSKFI